MKSEAEVKVLVELSKRSIEGVINNRSGVFNFTLENREWFLNHSWQLINKFIKENKGGN